MKACKKYLLITMVLFIKDAVSQSNVGGCEDIFYNAQALFSEDNYEAALKKLAAYKICDPQNSGKADTLIVKIYETVNRQKNEAITAKKQAVASKNEAEEQKRAVQNQLAMEYWNYSQAAIAQKDYLVGLHFMAEAIATTQDTDLKNSLLLDIEAYLPVSILKHIFPYIEKIHTGVFSTDGNYILTSAYQNAFLWDVNTGKKVFPDLKHNSYVRDAFFSPDGKQILTTAYSGYDPKFEGDFSASISVWNAVTGIQIGEPMKHKTQIATAFFDPAAKKILSICENDSLIHLWEAKSGNSIASSLTFDGHWRNIAFTHDGQKIITVDKGMMLRCQDIFTGKLAFPAIHNDSAVRQIVVSHDGKYLLMVTRSNAVILCDASTGQRIRSINAGPYIWNAVFSKDDTRIMTSSSDEIKLWETSTGKQAGKTIIAHGQGVYNFHPVLSADQKYILLSGENDVAQLWDVSRQKSLISTMKNENPLSVLDLNPDATYALTAGGSSARLWKIATKESNGFSIKTESPVVRAVFSYTKRLIMTIGLDSVVRLWDATTGRSFGNPIRHDDKVTTAVFSPNGKYIVTAAKNGIAHLWDASSGLPVGDTMKHEHEIDDAVFSPDGKYIVTASSWEKTARIWKAQTGKLNSIMQHDGYVKSVAFSSDGKYILTVCQRSLRSDLIGTIQIWLAATGKPSESPIKYEGESIIKAVFSNDGRYVLTIGGSGSKATIWNRITDKKNNIEVKQNGGIFNGVFSPDGKLILTFGDDRIARLWETATGKLFGLAIKHDDAITSALFSPDGEYILTASADSTARLWQTRTGKQIGPSILHNGRVNSAVFGRDENTIITASSDSTCHVRNVEGDLDIPADLFKLQAQVITGSTFNLQTREIEFIPAGEWIDSWDTLYEEYRNKARQHYKYCKYPQYNFWRRFFPEDAAKIRP